MKARCLVLPKEQSKGPLKGFQLEKHLARRLEKHWAEWLGPLKGSLLVLRKEQSLEPLWVRQLGRRKETGWESTKVPCWVSSKEQR